MLGVLANRPTSISQHRNYETLSAWNAGKTTSHPLSLQIVNCLCWLIPNASVNADHCWINFDSTDTLGCLRW